MIIQIWQGIALVSNADKYQVFLKEKVIPFYQCASGNLGVYLCREVNDQLVNFIFLSVWSSYDALANFTGPDIGVAVHSPEEKNLLLAFESIARNYEVFQILKPQKGTYCCVGK